MPERGYEPERAEVALGLDSNAVVTRRFKRLESITWKLRRIPRLRLTNMQDLGGCRAVVRDVATVYALRDRLRSALRLREREDDYILRPRELARRGEARCGW